MADLRSDPKLTLLHPRAMLAFMLPFALVWAVASWGEAQALARPALHWSRAENASSCIDPRALATRVIALTGPVLVAASDADLSIEGHIERKGERFVARVTATSRDGVQRGGRTLEQRGDCRALDPALAFVIALLIDPDLALHALPESLVALGAEGPAPEEVLLKELEAKPPVPAVVSTQKPAPEKKQVGTPARGEAPPRYQLELGISFAQRELPRAALGGVASVSLLLRRWLAIELSLRGVAMVGELALDEIGVRRVRAQSFGAALLVCPRYPGARFFVELCAAPEGALVRARGAGFSRAEVGRLAAFSLLLAAGVGITVRGAWFLHLRGFARRVFDPPRFSYSQPDRTQHAFSLATYSGGVNLSAGYRF